ncbi:hypothetical protein BE11_11540 [Sorangium cellulosum]|nr:hypothetical protein BE11_11540 [Sorangium cellulosum]
MSVGGTRAVRPKGNALSVGGPGTFREKGSALSADNELIAPTFVVSILAAADAAVASAGAAFDAS